MRFYKKYVGMMVKFLGVWKVNNFVKISTAVEQYMEDLKVTNLEWFIELGAKIKASHHQGQEVDADRMLK